jgi:hypothetical protein
MTLAPLLDAPPIIRFHAAFAFAAIGLGAVQLLAPKGTIPHRTIGWAWALLMLLVAGTSLFIHTIRTWGPCSSFSDDLDLHPGACRHRLVHTCARTDHEQGGVRRLMALLPVETDEISGSALIVAAFNVL